MPKKIIIVAGGTGGHIFPGIAIYEQLIEQGHLVNWIGTNQGLEAQILPKHGINPDYINITGFRGKNCLTKLLAPFKVIWAILQSVIILNRLQPDLVIGMGGFVAGPVGIASWLLRKKLVIHEQNAMAGTCNRILFYFADRVLESFPNSFPGKIGNSNKLTLIGNPIRKNLLQSIKTIDSQKLSKSNSKENKKFRILVLGGSRGARFLNQLIPTTLGRLSNVLITHQTGDLEYKATHSLYLKQNLHTIHSVKPFIEDMAQVYQNTDLIICRAGSSTLFEIMAIGIASILVPLPSAIDDHQTKNARYLADHNATILIKQSDLNQHKLKLIDIVEDLIINQDKLYAIRQAARKLYEQYKVNGSYFNKILDNIVMAL